jgi:hypothetical protein
MVEVTVGRRLPEQWRGGAASLCSRRGPALACCLGGAGEKGALSSRGRAGGSWPAGRGLKARGGRGLVRPKEEERWGGKEEKKKEKEKRKRKKRKREIGRGKEIEKNGKRNRKEFRKIRRISREIRGRVFAGFSGFSGVGVIFGTAVMARRTGRRDRGGAGFPS